MKPKLQRQIQAALPHMQDEDFDYHATDLYIRARPGVVRWLTHNYEFWTQVTGFRSNIPYNDPELRQLGIRELWLDVPFAGYWPNDQREMKHEHN